MRIHQEKCTRCKKCIPLCPLSAIKPIHDRIVIDQDLCVECGVCYRSGICAFDSFISFNPKADTTIKKMLFRLDRKATKLITKFAPQSYHLKDPRSIRQILSDPTVAFPLTGIYGRGTEEVKTNDVTGRYQEGEIGFCIEVGRPGIGATIREIQEFTIALAQLKVDFLPQNPITWMLKDSSGHIKESYLGERVLSAVIEFKIKEDTIDTIFNLIRYFDQQTKTVFTVGIISPMKTDGTIPILDKIQDQGFQIASHAKVNLGLGRAPEQK